MYNVRTLIAHILFSTSFVFAQEVAGDDEYSFITSWADSSNIRLDVYHAKNAKPIYDIVLPYLVTGKYHAHEFHNGNIYVIQRTGDYRQTQTWTDALRKYDKRKRATTIFLGRGLDYRVTSDEKHIAIEIDDSLLILDGQGATIRRFAAADFDIDGFDMMCFTNQSFFFSEGGVGVSFETVFKIDLSSFHWTRHPIPPAPFDLDCAFNPFNEMVVGSDYPFFYDADGHDAWAKKKPIVTLYLYDLKSSVTRILASSKTKRFHPRWIDSHHIEFDNPSGTNRIVRRISR